MAPALKPFQLLEINIISAQDLEPVSRKMRTYATAWVNPIRKLSTVVDAQGKNNPTWNDKFVFRVNEEFLRQDTSAVMIEIYGVHWFRHILVGTVRVLVGNLFPPPIRTNGYNAHSYSGMRFVALQVRRPSGRPQGILNIGVALLDSSMRSMPLYTQATSAVGYRDLMDDAPALELLQKNDNQRNNQLKPILRKSKSERSEFTAFESHNESLVAIPRKIDKGSSILSITESMDAFNGKKKKGKGSSILSISESKDAFNGKKKKGKASSVISGAELINKPKHKNKGKKGKPSSVLSDSVLSKQSSIFHKIIKQSDPKANNEEKNNTDKEKLAKSDEFRENKVVLEEKIFTKTNGAKKLGTPPTEKPFILSSLPRTGKLVPKYHNYDYGVPKAGKYVVGAPLKGNSIWSDSEVGPSPSEVAAALMAAEKKYPLSDNQSSVLDGWSVDQSIEGLKSKLERWRMELPPLYDRAVYSTSSYRSSNQHGHGRRSRSADGGGGGGLFSCFGNICGYECQCVCGKPPERKSRGTRFHSPARSYL